MRIQLLLQLPDGFIQIGELPFQVGRIVSGQLRLVVPSWTQTQLVELLVHSYKRSYSKLVYPLLKSLFG